MLCFDSLVIKTGTSSRCFRDDLPAKQRLFLLYPVKVSNIDLVDKNHSSSLALVQSLVKGFKRVRLSCFGQLTFNLSKPIK